MRAKFSGVLVQWHKYLYETQLTDEETARASSARSEEVDGRSTAPPVPVASRPEAVETVAFFRTAANDERNQEPIECLRRFNVLVDPMTFSRTYLFLFGLAKILLRFF